jgi:hypothetical protein
MTWSRGFLAAIKHKKKIIQTVKMLYAGQKLPCFETGEQAIAKLQKRLSPVDMTSEKSLYDHCQE